MIDGSTRNVWIELASVELRGSRLLHLCRALDGFVIGREHTFLLDVGVLVPRAAPARSFGGDKRKRIARLVLYSVIVAADGCRFACRHQRSLETRAAPGRNYWLWAQPLMAHGATRNATG